MKKSKFRVGDEVIDQDGRLGIIINRNSKVKEYPICVQFYGDIERGGLSKFINTYTEEGYQYLDDLTFCIRKATKLDKALK